MEEKKGQNTLYLVIGVATLVVAIIGATFAYFSASSSNATEIQGGTNDVGASLDLTVKRVLFNVPEVEGTEYKNLVPAVINLTKEGIQTAVNNNCVADSYTGCHLYKITASSSQDLAAEVLLQSFKTENVTDVSAWKFVVFKADETDTEGTITYTVNDIITGTTAENFYTSTATKTQSDTIKGYNIHKNPTTGEALTMTKGDVYTYYLLIYLENSENIQNPGEEDEENAEYSATGTYSGSVALNAAGGTVIANFTTTLS